MLYKKLEETYQKTVQFCREKFDDQYDVLLQKRISAFNTRNFPNPEFKYLVHEDRSYEQIYTKEKLRLFIAENQDVLSGDNTRGHAHLFDEGNMPDFLLTWYIQRIRQELRHYLERIEGEEDVSVQKVMKLILSRTARSCRATTHYDLATLKDRQSGPYYSYKHYKIFSPAGSISKRQRYYTGDTLRSLSTFASLKKQVHIGIIHGDSRFVDIFDRIRQINQPFSRLLIEKKVSGIFSSPP